MSQDLNVYQRLEQKPYDSFYVYVETVIHHPLEKVWPRALEIGRWMSAHRLETLDGKPGEVGHFERVYPRDLGPEVPEPHYHLYGIAHVIPLKLIVLEVFPEQGGSYGKTKPKWSFDSVLLTDLGGETQVGFHMVDVHLEKGDAGFHARREEELRAVRGMLEAYFDNLRRLVEQAD
jgi:hypothetical protein